MIITVWGVQSTLMPPDGRVETKVRLRAVPELILRWGWVAKLFSPLHPQDKLRPTSKDHHHLDIFPPDNSKVLLITYHPRQIYHPLASDIKHNKKNKPL